MDDPVALTGPPLTIAGVLADPSASFALKSVVRLWSRRDGVDAANDAQVLCALFTARADQRPGGLL